MFLALLAFIAVAVANPMAPIQVELGDPPTAAEYAADLVGGTRPDRRFAARELRRQVRLAARGAAGASSERQLEWRVALADLHDDAYDATIQALLEHEDVRGLCAEMLAAFDDPSSVPHLEAALARETRPAVRRRIAVALADIGAP